MMRLYWTPAAAADLQHISDSLKERHPHYRQPILCKRWCSLRCPMLRCTTAASGTEESSLEALRKASATSYYKGNGELWVKLVSSGDVLGSGPGSGPSGGTTLQVNR